MNVTFNPTASAQAAVPSFTQSRANTASLASTIASQASSTTSESGFFSTILDAITFIPRKIWGFIQMIFCCSSQSLADRIASDPKAAAKDTFDRLEKATDLGREFNKFGEELKTIGNRDKEWQKENKSSFLTFFNELLTLTKGSEKAAIKVLYVVLAQKSSEIKSEIENL